VLSNQTVKNEDDINSPMDAGKLAGGIKITLNRPKTQTLIIVIIIAISSSQQLCHENSRRC